MRFFRSVFRTLLSPFRFLLSVLSLPFNSTRTRPLPPPPALSSQRQVLEDKEEEEKKEEKKNEEKKNEEKKDKVEQKQQPPHNTGPTLLINHTDSTLTVHTHESKSPLATLAANARLLLHLPPATALNFCPHHPSPIYYFRPYQTVATAACTQPIPHHIHPVPVPAAQLPSHFHPVPASDACLRGYHISHIDPFVIESDEGARHFVYEPLANDGCDYQVYSDTYYCKHGWVLNLQHAPWATLQTSVHYSQDSFLNGLTSCVHDSKDNAATRSRSVRYFLDAAPPAEALYTRSRELAINYTLTVDPAVAPLNPDFVAAIRALDASGETVDAATTFDSLDDELKQQLTALIAKYGTHVPEKMTFGGYYALVTAVSAQDLKTSLQRGVDLCAGATVPIDGVPVRGSPPAEAEVLANPELTFSASAFKYVYRGGAGGKSEWGGSGNMSASVPVAVELVRLSELVQREQFAMEGVEETELAAKRCALGLAIEREIGKPMNLDEKRLSLPTFRITALRVELHEASRHRKSLCGRLYMEPSEFLCRFNVDPAAPSRYELFDMPERKPYNWHNGDMYRFRGHGSVHTAKFRVPLDRFARGEMYVRVYGELKESTMGVSKQDDYRLKPLTIWLGEKDGEEWWVDERFKKVTHVTTGKNVNKAEGKIFVYVATDWVFDD